MRSGQRPSYIIVLIAAATVVPLVTLMWLGWRLLDQDRMLETRQVQDRVERAADLIVAEIERAISASGRRLVSGNEAWPEGAVALVFERGRVRVYPRDRVAYVPVAHALPEAPAGAFADGERLEFRLNDSAVAIDVFREIVGADNPAVRAGALLRLGRNLSRARRIEEALAAYEELSRMDRVLVSGVPAGLAGRYARLGIFERENRRSDLAREAEQLSAELRASRWQLTGPVYWLYLKDADGWRGVEKTGETQGERFAAVVDNLWERSGSVVGPAREAITAGGQTMAVVWEVSPEDTRALVVTREFFESQWLAGVIPLAEEQGVSFALRDARGNTLFGETAGDDLPKTDRAAHATLLPWTVVAASLVPPGQDPTFARRRQLLIAGFGLLVSMALTASYLIFCGVNRERALAHMQSDFVAAVSHEFRTPLTALRQFTDMLREKPSLDEDRRRVCYEALGGATDRLGRLVESLLDFGRMEAGVHTYRLEPHDCTELARHAVEEFREEAQAAGYDVQFHPNGATMIEGDPEALSRAFHNLLDNAVKYSPGEHDIQVGVERSGDQVKVSVEDHGIGIPTGERAAIFTKFKRGDQAKSRGIRGTGIGLAMVDDIVRAHHGRVDVESTPGHGSTFTIVLPLKEHTG